ncbi:MAG: YihY/virulence factor BrkB family protein [Clostridiales bacterium]|nr:YihY/virulence factor BrkB family protein [Clostridiales bacterium]
MSKWRDKTAVQFGMELVHIYLDKRISRASAQLAYYMLLSVFPVLMIISTILGMLPIENSDALNRILAAVPSTIGAILEDYLAYVTENQSAALLSGGIIMTLTASSATFRGLMDIFGEIFGERIRGGAMGVLFSILMSLGMLIMIYGALLIVLLGDWLLDVVRVLLDIPVLHYGWRLIQIVMPFAAIFLFLSLVYRITARTPRHKRTICPGALLTSVILVVATSIFSQFITSSSRYATVYGSLASVIILLVWLFLCSNIVIMGNVFNFVWANFEDKYGTGKLPHLNLSKKGK